MMSCQSRRIERHAMHFFRPVSSKFVPKPWQYAISAQVAFLHALFWYTQLLEICYKEMPMVEDALLMNTERTKEMYGFRTK